MNHTTAHQSSAPPGVTRPAVGWVSLIKGASRWVRHQWRCFKYTGGVHEIDLYTGVCRYCGARLKERL